MAKYHEGKTENGTPLCDWDKVYADAAKLRKFAVKVLSEVEYITERQRNWYKGICLPFLVENDENKETKDWWDRKVKKECAGLAYLKKEGLVAELNIGGCVTEVTLGRLTTKGVGKKNMTAFIDEILSQSIHFGWGVVAPDKELRSHDG